jgi:hypothetical protein
VYSPHEPKIGILRVFPVLAEIYRKEKEPELGLFSFKIETLIFPVSSTEDKWGRIHSFTLWYTVASLLKEPEGSVKAKFLREIIPFLSLSLSILTVFEKNKNI